MVYRIGATGTDLANVGAPVFLDEYTSAGAFVQPVAMPTTVNGAHLQGYMRNDDFYASAADSLSDFGLTLMGADRLFNV